jgi:hypothetical protein
VNAEEDAEYTARVIRAMGGIPPAEAKQLRADLDAARKLLEAWDQWAANVDTNRPPGVLIMATTLLLVQKRGG